jgi:hypothetical protein
MDNMEVTPRGGKRLGAGRKKGMASIKAEEARKYMISRITEELEPILTGQIELAKGLYHETTDDEGKRRVYHQPPDSRVAAYLLNQLVGRPKETLDMNVIPVFSLKELSKRASKFNIKEINSSLLE